MTELLVVASKVKKYIKETGDLQASAKSLEQLSKAVEILCKKGIESAKSNGRKTVMDRDISIDYLL